MPPLSVTRGIPKETSLLISGSADATIRVWAVADTRRRRGEEQEPRGGGAAEAPWRCIAVLEGHAASVSSLACYPLVARGPSAAPASNEEQVRRDEDAFLLVSTAGDGSVVVWACGSDDRQPGPDEPLSAHQPMLSSDDILRGSDGGGGGDAAHATAAAAFGQARWQLQQRIGLGAHIAQAAALTHLPSAPAWLLLAAAGTDKAVHLYIRAPGRQARFSPACRLEGHDNWVRSLSFCHAAMAPPLATPQTAAAASEAGGAAEDGQAPSDARVELLLASASQDRYGRIWMVAFEDLDPDLTGSAASAISRYSPKPRFAAAGGCRMAARLEALLIGHEDWLHSIQWRKAKGGFDAPIDRRELCLLTSSMDRWEGRGKSVATRSTSTTHVQGRR